MARKKLQAFISRITKGGERKYPWHEHFKAEVEYSSTYSTCYCQEKIFKKIKGGFLGGNYKGAEDGDVYRIVQIK